MDHATFSTTTLLTDAAAAAIASDPDARRLWDLIYALQERPTRDVFEAAATWCRAASPPLRRLGVIVLSELGLDANLPFARESEPLLLSLLEDSDPSVVAAAALALGTLGADDTAALCRVANHRADDVRAAVARSLCDLEGPGVVPTLIALTRDSEAEVRRLATSGLGGFDRDDTEAVRLALVGRLSDTDTATREEAIFALAQLGDDRVDEALRAAREEPETSELIEMAALAVECRRDRDPRLPRWPPRPQ